MSHRAPLIAILCGDPNPPSRARFEQAAAARGARTMWLDPREPLPAEKPAAALVRTGGLTDERALAAVDELELCGVVCLPGRDALSTVRDKLEAGDVLKSAGVPTPPAMAADAPGVSELAERRFGYPMVVKPRFGMRGDGVRIVRDRNDLTSALAPLAEKPGHVIVQPFVGDGVGEVRVLVAGGVVLGSVRKVPVSGDFRANANHGATVAAFDPRDDAALAGPGAAIQAPDAPSPHAPAPDAVALDAIAPDAIDAPAPDALALDATAALHLPFSAVDLVWHEGGWLVLEVNSAPGFEAFERATGVDVAGALLDVALEAARAAGERS